MESTLRQLIICMTLSGSSCEAGVEWTVTLSGLSCLVRSSGLFVLMSIISAFHCVAAWNQVDLSSCDSTLSTARYRSFTMDFHPSVLSPNLHEFSGQAGTESRSFVLIQLQWAGELSRLPLLLPSVGRLVSRQVDMYPPIKHSVMTVTSSEWTHNEHLKELGADHS